jgi:hypothetical protein
LKKDALVCSVATWTCSRSNSFPVNSPACASGPGSQSVPPCAPPSTPPPHHPLHAASVPVAEPLQQGQGIDPLAGNSSEVEVDADTMAPSAGRSAQQPPMGAPGLTWDCTVVRGPDRTMPHLDHARVSRALPVKSFRFDALPSVHAAMSIHACPCCLSASMALCPVRDMRGVACPCAWRLASTDRSFRVPAS